MAPGIYVMSHDIAWALSLDIPKSLNPIVISSWNLLSVYYYMYHSERSTVWSFASCPCGGYYTNMTACVPTWSENFLSTISVSVREFILSSFHVGNNYNLSSFYRNWVMTHNKITCKMIYKFSEERLCCQLHVYEVLPSGPSLDIQLCRFLLCQLKFYILKHLQPSVLTMIYMYIRSIILQSMSR